MLMGARSATDGLNKALSTCHPGGGSCYSGLNVNLKDIPPADKPLCDCFSNLIITVFLFSSSQLVPNTYPLP